MNYENTVHPRQHHKQRAYIKSSIYVFAFDLTCSPYNLINNMKLKGLCSLMSPAGSFITFMLCILMTKSVLVLNVISRQHTTVSTFVITDVDKCQSNTPQMIHLDTIFLTESIQLITR